MSGFNVVFGVDLACFKACAVGGMMACKETGLIFQKTGEKSLAPTCCTPGMDAADQGAKYSWVKEEMAKEGIEVSDKTKGEQHG